MSARRDHFRGVSLLLLLTCAAVLVREPARPRLTVPAPAERQPREGPVDPNRASAAELNALPGVGPTLARRIVEGRAAGPYRRCEDLDRVRGVGPRTVERLCPRLRFDPAITGREGTSPPP